MLTHDQPEGGKKVIKVADSKRVKNCKISRKFSPSNIDGGNVGHSEMNDSSLILLLLFSITQQKPIKGLKVSHVGTKIFLVIIEFSDMVQGRVDRL